MDYTAVCYNCFARKSNKNACPTCGYTDNAAGKPEKSFYLPPGTALAEKYITGKILGQGGFGITYLGWDSNLERKLAIKEFFPHGIVSRLPGQAKVVSSTGEESENYEYGLKRFIKEAKTLALFEEHPNIVTIRDYFKANNTAYLIMNYIEGMNLEQYLRSKGGRISFDQALMILMPVLDALREVHAEEIMHRDISPDNILISKKGRVILIDFGAARQEIREKSKSLSVILKAGYAPEEQYRSRGNQGPWTDIYAVAATFYRAITGKAPPEAMDRLAEDDLVPVSKLGVTIGGAQEAALIKALAVRAEERYRSVEEFQSALIGTEPAKALAETVPMREKRVIPPVIKGLAADVFTLYFIDYERGSIPLASLPIGARVVDPTWVWEFSTGNNKPIIWVVVAKNHYKGLPSHVTLLTEELIGRLSFDNSKRLLGFFSGANHWGESGKGNATLGLRPWLNSTGIHSSGGLYRTFPANFKRAVLTTNVPSKDWKSGKAYTTSDHVFIPSTTEMGDTDHRSTYQIGTVYPYFWGTENNKRAAQLNGEPRWYWTRSPASHSGSYVRNINSSGDFVSYLITNYGHDGVRPALNLKSEIKVSKIRN